MYLRTDQVHYKQNVGSYLHVDVVGGCRSFMILNNVPHIVTTFYSLYKMIKVIIRN